ncbi:VanZ family protein [Shewanella sp. VB17]|uniref:VanZ family protein n=1 Tax=Shewanella sp. VB17 TaxID=2739432 RepID=UPI00156310A0|nr:VanZ family protein [Shewanella sp. VB17]NRD75105.1 VanZ family protein [Shewanella sp. VB17]
MISRQYIFKLALAAALIVISYLVFSQPNYPQSIPNMDKVGHLLSFFGLAYLTHLAFKPKWYFLAITLACYAIFIELVQSYLPYRSASVADFAADMVGVLLFYCCHWGYQRYINASQIKHRK